MATKIKTFNYMEIAREIVRGKEWPRGSDKDLSPKEYVDKRIDELRMLAASPDHQMLAAFMEQEIAESARYALSIRDPIAPILYALRTCNPFHSPIAKSLSQEKIDSFRYVTPGSPGFEKWDENQQWYAKQMLEGSRTRLVASPSGVTLRTGCESIAHTITSSSFPISQYFYAMHVAPECFPDQIAQIVRHAAGVEQVKNSHVSKTIRKNIVEAIKTGDYPEPMDVERALAANLSEMANWIKPRDTLLAAAYVKGARDVTWLEQFAPASTILIRMTEGLAEKGFTQKWGGSFPTMILDLCHHVMDSDPALATKALYDLATAMASDKILGFAGAKDSLDRITLMANTYAPGDKANTTGVLAMKLIGHKLGIESDKAVTEFINDNGLKKPMEKMMDKLYPNVIERAKTLQSLGFKSNSPALLREKGRALMDDLGM